MSLSTPLGEWLAPLDLHLFYYSPGTDRLLAQNDDKSWSAYSRIQGRHKQSLFSGASVDTGFGCLLLQHGTLSQVDVTPVGINLKMTKKCIRNSPPPFPLLPTEPRLSVPDLGWINQVWFTQHSESELASIAACLLSGTCQAVSDGSAFEREDGTAAWCIGSTSQFEIISAGMRIPGPPESHCSYRSELAGIYSILKATWSVIEQNHITAGAIEIGSDSLSVLTCVPVGSSLSLAGF